jgi:hypothetical protein
MTTQRTIKPSLPDANDVPRFLRVDSSNDEIHHIEMWSPEALEANNRVFIWIALELGKVSIMMYFLCSIIRLL